MARNGSSPAPPGRRLKRWLALLVALALLWLGGALVYIDQVEHLPPPGDARTDAIVVLTGGTARLATALRLLNEHKAERLLVSGVGPTVTKASLLQAVLPSLPDAGQAAANGQASPAGQGGDLQRLFECCVDLGFEAADTAGNALETAGWLNAHGYTSIRLVTANYHMPRSLVEFSRRLPGIAILPHPVQPDAMRVEGWWQRRQAAGFLLGEYSKYAVALIRARLDAAIAVALGESGGTAPVAPAAPQQPAPAPSMPIQSAPPQPAAAPAVTAPASPAPQQPAMQPDAAPPDPTQPDAPQPNVAAPAAQPAPQQPPAPAAPAPPPADTASPDRALPDKTPLDKAPE